MYILSFDSQKAFSRKLRMWYSSFVIRIDWVWLILTFTISIKQICKVNWYYYTFFILSIDIFISINEKLLTYIRRFCDYLCNCNFVLKPNFCPIYSFICRILHILCSFILICYYNDGTMIWHFKGIWAFFDFYPWNSCVSR